MAHGTGFICYKINGSRINNEISRVDRLPSINLSHTKNKSYSNSSKISNRVHNGVDNEVSFTEKIQSYHSNPNCTKIKCHGDNNADNNRNLGIKVGIAEF